MNKLGEGIAFAALCVCCTWLEVSGTEAGPLWIVVVAWAIFGFNSNKKESKK